MKILATAWMVMNDGTHGFEGYEIIEHKRELDKFKLEHEDETFDIVFNYNLIPNNTDYEIFEYDNDGSMFDKYMQNNIVDELTVLLMFSTSEVI